MSEFVGEFCIVRTESAGVHCGFLRQVAGDACVLTEARIVYQWAGANTLHELSLYGSADGDGPVRTRISEPVPRVLLPSGVVAVIPCSEAAAEDLRRSRWAE